MFLLKNAAVATLNPPSIISCDIRIDEGMITAVGRSLRPRRDDEVVDIAGAIVMPGLVNSHTHLYSALARGMRAPKTSPRNFVETLQKVWWNLDEALDDEAVYYSALVGAMDAARCGTTALIDHHASPNAIPGSLDRIKDAILKVGIRGILCYETTDRGGIKKRDQGLQENERFVTENANHPRLRGTIGAHAQFTLSDDSLRQIGDLAQMYDCGAHIHVAEDKADVVDAVKKRGTDIVGRLDRFGLLRKKSLIAHGVHLTRQQLERVERSGAWMLHNPRSNMNNAVGYAPLDWYGPHTALGTDGFPADMIEELKIGFFRNAESSHRVPFSRLPVLLQNGNVILSQFFGSEFGAIKAGVPADLIVLDYQSPTPLTAANLHGHLLFGMSRANVQHVMGSGSWIVWNRQLMTVDEEAIMAKARVAAQRVWKRMKHI